MQFFEMLDYSPTFYGKVVSVEFFLMFLTV